MKTSIIEIGNSRGLRLPKPILEQCQIRDFVELVVEGKTIVLKPLRAISRKGWAKAFVQAGKEKGQVVADITDLDSKDWIW